jgi:hypothetical protein
LKFLTEIFAACLVLVVRPACAVLPPGVHDGAAVDVVPWGERMSWDSGKDVGVYWEDPRDITRVEAIFAGTPPDPKTARLEWWQSQWPERRIPRDHLSGAGWSGWLDIGDWYRGGWRDADVVLTASNNTWSFTFRPVNQKEFPRLTDFPAAYRTTMKLRFLFEGSAPKFKEFHVFSDSTWKSVRVAIEWGGTAQSSQTWDGHLEAFNGWIETLSPLGPGSGVSLKPDGTWESSVQARTDGIQATVWYTESPNVNSFDNTIVTVRARQQTLSFDARNVAKGTPMFTPLYGVLVRRLDDTNNYATALARWKARTDKPLYERVFDEPEQTFARAWSEMPAKHQFYIPLGCEGGRQRFGVDPDGSVFCRNDRIDQPVGKDTPKRTWGGDSLRYHFGLPQGTPADRWTEDHCLPIIHARWETNGVRYTQTALATRLEAGDLGWPGMQVDSTTVLMMRIACENVSSQSAEAAVLFSLEGDGGALPLSERDGLAYAQSKGGENLRLAIENSQPGRLTSSSGQIRFSETLPAQGKTTITIKIPFITLDSKEELTRLKGMTFAEEFERVKTFWRTRADQSAQIHTPVAEINSFYRADVSHLLINCGREVGADRLMARVGSFSYGVYGNESCMMITDLDRRGFHQEAERCLETFLHYQGTSALPGDYSQQKGVFNGAGGWESGGYNQHHGWILWAMAEHYWYSGDRAWLSRNADKLVAACDWIIHERSRTRDLPGMRSLERGLLPAGSLEDIGDWRCWLSNNGFSWWGMDSVAKALADVGHPQAQRLQGEADAYRADLLAAFEEAMVRSPMVGLRDGSFIPAMPSEVHRRGRTFGWITTTLEGPIYLIRIGALAPDAWLSRCIMQDYEDNLYLSDQYGYSPRHIAEHWFSHGGFSMQPHLLCSPHPYLMRDEIKHFLRSYFNALAVAYYPNTQMLTEHPLEEMGDWRGDHYKSSDESNSTYWLRLMFVDERQEDLYLGMAIPRAWLEDGNTPGIERAATRFGRLSFKFRSQANSGSIEAVFDPPHRRIPRQTFLRFRHPAGKPMRRVMLDGKDWTKFDPKKELVELPALSKPATIRVEY